LIKRALAALAWVYSAAHVYTSGVRQPLQNFYGDFLASFPSPQISAMLGRLDLFRGSLAEQWATNYIGSPRPLWHYGPVQHLITLPLFLFADLPAAYRAWLFATYAFLAVIFAIAAMVFEWRGWFWIAAIGALNYGPMYEALTQRNVEIFELMLILAAFALLQRGRALTAGVLIGVAAMAKFLPLIFLPYFVVRRMWRALAGSLLAIVPIAIATELLLGWRDSGILFQLRKGGFIDMGLNQSLSGMIIRLLRWTHAPLSPDLASRVAIVLGLAALSWLFLRRRGPMDIEWSTMIAAMVLLPPHNQQYYFVLLLFSYWALLARRIRLGWLAVSYVLVAMPLPFSVLNRIAQADLFPAYLHAGIPFIGAAVLAVLSGTSHAVQDVPGTPCHSTRPSPTSLPS
jgi:Glycosyltransferase family 87